MKPRISVITVNYNNRDGLARTQRSLEAQSIWAPSTEWIVVDGGSTDGVQETIDTSKLDNIHFLSSLDDGIYDAMNRGLARCTGDWVLFLNSGDTLADENVLARLLVDISKRNSHQDVLVGDWISSFPKGEFYRKARSQRYLVHSLPSSHQSILFPAHALANFEYDTSYCIAGDYFICAWLLMANCNFILLHFAVSRFEMGGMSYSHPLTLIREAARVQRKVLGLNRLVVACSIAIRIASITRLRVKYSLQS